MHKSRAVAGSSSLAIAASSSPGRVTVALIAKTPQPGRVKTRLCPPCTPVEAAEVASLLLTHAIDAIAQAVLSSPVPIRPAILLDGEIGSWIPSGWHTIAQRGHGLDERLANGLADLGEPALVMAMDSPEVTAKDIVDAVGALSQHHVVLGPTLDGGYWCIGARAATHELTVGVPMSQPNTFDAQCRRIDDLGLTLSLAATHDDVDTFDDACRVARRLRGTNLAEYIESLEKRQVHCATN